MKREIQKAVAAVLAIVLVASLISACGKKKEPADSLVPDETYTEATVQQPEADELTAWVREAIADESWNGDWASLTDAQRKAVQKFLTEKGYDVAVSENGVTYYSYTPTADKEEIAEIVQKVLPDKKWDGEYASLTDTEKEVVRAELIERGYDVDVGKEGFEFKNEQDRKEETTRAEYNQLPSKEMLAGVIEAELGMEGYKKWDRNFLSLTAAQRANILKSLNDYGYHLGINDKGEMYILHLPANTVTFDSAYTAAPIGGTTAVPTTIVTTAAEKNEEDENVTGTTADKSEPAPELTQTAIRTFGGSKSDLFQHIAATSDGGYVATMLSQSKDGDLADANQTWKQSYSAVIKFDKDFNVQWTGMLGESSGKSLGVYLTQTAELTDGSFVAVGYANPVNATTVDAADCILVKYAKDGTREWLKYLKGTSADQLECVAATPDGGFVAGGQSKSADGDFDMLHENCNDAILVKCSADGTREWTQSVNGGAGATHFVAVAVTDAGYIYAACQASSVGKLQLDMASYAGFGSSDGIVFKFNPSGEIIRHRAIGGSGADTVTCLTLCDQGGVLVGGSMNANSKENSVFAGKENKGKSDAFLVRLDASLQVEWVNVYGGTEADDIYAVAQTRDGFIAVGESQSSTGLFSFLGSGSTDGFVLSVSENGTATEKYALSGSATERARGVSATGKQAVVVGATQSIDGSFTALTPASNGTSRIGYIATYALKS